MTNPQRVVSSRVSWLITIVLSLTGALAHATTCDVDADGDIDRKDFLAILADIGERASGPNDPRDADRNGRILSNDAQLCARRCTLPLCNVPPNKPPANKAPIAKNDAATTALDTPVRINVIANDRDRDGRIVPRKVTIVTKPKHGKVTNHRNGTVTYSPALGFRGRDRFRYTVKDNRGAKSNVAKVTVTVRPGNVPPGNVPPVANNDSAATAVNTPVLINVVANDTDANSNLDPTTVAIVANPANGALINNLNGTVTHSPSPGFFGTDSFTYNVKDTQGATSNTATVTVGVNAAPTADAGPDANAVTDQPVTLDGSGSSDPNGDMITFSWRFLSVPPTSGLMDTDIVNPTSPAPMFTPDEDGAYELELTVTDPGGLSDTDTVVITAATPNVAPNADAGPDQNAEVLTLVNLDGSGSSDPDNGPVTPLTFQWTFAQLPAGSLLTNADIANATSAQASFTPDVIGPYRLTLTVSDGDLSDSDDVDINVALPNVPPNANAGADFVVQLGPPAETATLNGTGSNDPDNGPVTPLTFEWTFVSVAPGSSLTNGDIQDANTDTASFTPDAAGMYTLQLRVFDGLDEGFDEVMVTANAAPVAVGDAFSVDEDTPLTVPAPGVLTNDTDANSDPLIAVLDSGPTNAQSFTLNADGSFDYTPNPGFSGEDTFTYHARDGAPANPNAADSNVATVTITVNEVNDAPVAVDDVYSVDEDNPLTGTSVLANDTDDENDTLTAVLDTGPTNAASFTLNPDGTFSYTPNADFNGTDTFTYHANDGTSDSNVATATITVDPVNDAPSFTAGGDQTINEDAGPQTVNGWATVISPGPANESGQTLSFNITGNTNPGLFSAGPVVSPAGVLTFTPAPNANGSASIMLVIQDNGGTANGGVDTSGSQGFSITVLPVNDPPQVAPPAAYPAHAHIAINIPDGATDLFDGSTITDVDGASATPFSITATGPFASTSGGSVTIASNGSFSYNPPAGFTGANDSFLYQICDSGVPGSACTNATATVAVSGPRVWFVDNSLGSSGDGRLSSPFNTLAAADVAANTSGDRTFVLTGAGPYTGGFGLLLNQRLIGEGVVDTNFDTALGITPPATSVARPGINGTRPIINGTITLATGSTARGSNVNSTGATGVSGSGATSLIVNQVSVTTTTGTAVNLLNSGGTVSFTSVSSNGAANGILLNNTTGSFTVTSSGTAGSGGTIQNSTGNGITLNNVQNVSFSRMNIQSSGGHGINGATVNGFRLDNCLIENNGDIPFETGVDISNLTGTAIGGTNPTSITNTTIRNNFAFQLQITNTTGTLTDLQMSGNTISSTGASGTIANLFNFLGAGGGTGSLTLNLTSGSFTGGAPATATGLQCDHSGTSGTATCNVSGATFTNNNVAVSVSQAQGGNLSFNVTGNTATGNRSHGLNLFVAAIGTGTVDGSFTNNTVGTLNTAGSGSNLGFGIRIQNEGSASGAPPVNVLVSGNTVQEMTNFAGINLNQGIAAQAATRATNATITNNVVREVDNSRAIIVQQNNTTAPGSTCADISGNDMSNIAGNIGDGTKIRFRQLAGGTFNVRQQAPTAAANALELDDANSVGANVTTDTQISIGGIVTFNAGACPLP